MIGKCRFAEADAPRVLIDHLAGTEKLDVHGVEMGLIKVPQLDGTKIVEMNAVNRRVSGGCGRRNALRTLGKYPVALAEIDLDGHRVCDGSRCCTKQSTSRPDAPVSTSFGFAKTFSIKVAGTIRSDTSR